MTKEEFLKLAEKKWEEISKHKSESENFYEYEKGFDELWVEFGRVTLEGDLSKSTLDRRKKKDTEPLRSDRDA